MADVEGLTIYYRRDGVGYLIASSQGNSRFNVYRREGNNPYLGTFQIASGPFGSAIDTDGIDVINMSLGPRYPQGLFVAQNDDVDFKFVRWDDVAMPLGLAVDTTGHDVRPDSCADVASVSVSPDVGERRGGCDDSADRRGQGCRRECDLQVFGELVFERRERRDGRCERPGFGHCWRGLGQHRRRNGAA